MMNDIFTVWLREMIRFWRAKSRLIGSLAMPFFWLAIMGVGFGRIVPSVGGVNYTEFLLPGIIGMTLLFSSTFSGVSIIVDKQFGFLREILVAPISRLSIMLGKAFGGATTAIINGIIMITLAMIIGIHVSNILGVLISLAFMLLISLTFVSFGIAVASRISDTSGFQIIMNFFIMPTFFLSGALFPINQTPTWMQSIAYINPLFYGVDGLRHSLVGVSVFPLITDLAVLLAFCLILVSIGTYLFRKIEA